jgi:allophanate hydrolase
MPSFRGGNPAPWRKPASLLGKSVNRLTPREAIETALRRIAARGDDRVWISRRGEAELRERAPILEAAGPAGRPLYGLTFAVKDNIDVAGMPTTAGCPAFAYTPTRSAPVVARLEAAGAMLVGKTNMDQFATGLVGTRSPYGVPANAFHPAFIPGGSSSGSAVAVAARLVDFALGTDTAGSGRVPAGFNAIVGLKPSIGLIDTTGVVPACRSLDCVSIFARTVDEAWRAFGAAAASVTPLPETGRFIFAVPRRADLKFFGDADYERLYHAAIARLESSGGTQREIDYAPFAEAAALLYSDAGVAERVAAFGDFVAAHPDAVLPVTRAVIERGRAATAVDVWRLLEKRDALRRTIGAALQGADALVLPTAPTIYRVAEVEADPIALNTNLGTYTNFVNLMDMAAIAVPAGFRADGLPFGITFIAPAGQDAPLASLAREFEREWSVAPPLIDR